MGVKVGYSNTLNNYILFVYWSNTSQLLKMVTFFLLLLAGMGLSQTTESNDGDYTEWMIVGDYIDEAVNVTAEPLDDSQGLLDAADPPVLSDEMCYDLLKSYDEELEMKAEQEMKLKADALNDDKLDQPYRYYGSGLYGNRFRQNSYYYGNRYRYRYRPYLNGPYSSYGSCLRTIYSGSLCHGRRRVNYVSNIYCCQPNYYRPFVFRRGRYVRCRCY